MLPLLLFIFIKLTSPCIFILDQTRAIKAKSSLHCPAQTLLSSNMSGNFRYASINETPAKILIGFSLDQDDSKVLLSWAIRVLARPNDNIVAVHVLGEFNLFLCLCLELSNELHFDLTLSTGCSQ